MLDPYNNKEQVEAYAKAGVSAVRAWSCCRARTRAQAMDVLSSQANLAGYKALVDAMAGYSRVLPMMMTAAGTVTPAKVFIVGAGVAGPAGDRDRAADGCRGDRDRRAAGGARGDREPGRQVRGLRAGDAATKGGYARPLTPEEQAEQAKMVAEHLKTPGHRRHHRADPRPQGAADRHRRDGPVDEAGGGRARHGGRERRQCRGQRARRDRQRRRRQRSSAPRTCPRGSRRRRRCSTPGTCSISSSC